MSALTQIFVRRITADQAPEFIDGAEVQVIEPDGRNLVFRLDAASAAKMAQLIVEAARPDAKP